MTRRSMKWMLFSASSFAAISAVVSPVFAADSAPAGGLEEIVVTAQKRAENLQDVPISMTAFSASTLERANVTATEDLAKLTPGLTINRFSTFVGAYMRGIGTRFSNPGLEPTVATYVDEVYSARPAVSVFDYLDVEHVEVLKGPQGTLYGRNSTGGAISVTTNKPTDEFEGSEAVTYGRFNEFRNDAVINIPLNDKVSTRFAVTYDRNDGYVTDPNLDHRLNDRDQVNASGKVKIKASDRLTVMLQGSYGRKRDWSGLAFIVNPSPSLLNNVGTAAGGTPTQSFYQAQDNFPNTTADQVALDVWNAGAHADLELDDVTLSSITSYQHVQNSSAIDGDGTEITYANVDSIKEVTNSFSQEFRAVSTGDTRLKWTAGLYYYHENDSTSEFIYGAQLPGAASPFTQAQSPQEWLAAGGHALFTRGLIGADAAAGYGQATYNITDKVSTTLGARYTWEQKRLSGAINQLLPSTAPATPASPRTLTFYNFSPKAGLEYRPMQDVMLYAQWSIGYKSGGFSLPAVGAVNEVRPEKLEAWEFGWKTQFDRLRFNGAGYYYQYSNIQVSRSSPTSPLPIVTNAARAEVYGVEGDLQYAATDRLRFGLGAAWTHTEFTNFLGDVAVAKDSLNPACAAVSPGLAALSSGCVGYNIVTGSDLAGNPLPFAPEFTGNVNVEYTIPLPHDTGMVTLSSIVSYTSSLNFGYDPSFLREGSHVLLSAGATWVSSNGKYDLALSGSNLTDEKVKANTNITGFGGSLYTPGPPLWWHIKAGVHF